MPLPTESQIEPQWDKFKQTTVESQSASEKNKDFVERSSVALKIITVFIVFSVILLAATVAKGALFFIVAQTWTGRWEKSSFPTKQLSTL